MKSRNGFLVAASMAATLITTLSFNLSAQYPINIGGGSIASFPPAYKAKSEANGATGFNATAMLSRKIFVDEGGETAVDGFQAPTRPLPTNDWWTDIINSTFSGALWSYPAMLNTSENGVSIYWPSYWADNAKEIKSRSNLRVGGRKFLASATIAKDWHDWDVVFRMPSVDESAQMTVTSAHGSPFTWFEFTGMEAELTASDAPQLFGLSTGYAGMKIGDDRYGLYFPAGVHPVVSDRQITFSQPIEWLVVGLLRSDADLMDFARYATSVPRDTRVEWNYDEPTARIASSWTVSAENLRNSSASAPVLQGFLPHAYKYALPGASLPFIDSEGFSTPRGVMKLAASDSGTFSYAYQFSGMLPTYAAPAEGEGFSSEVLRRLTSDYADKGGFGADTYWGGKGLVQMALNMSFARESGDTEVYEKSKAALRQAFENWLTYTPGEDNFFFSYYPRWGGMLGFDVSYDSDAFNDHHFHFGYFTYAAALLCMEDADFAANYGDILTLIAKDYANWDRNDTRFPFMRTLDPWCGHSWAGGLGDAGNDNGNGQESSSEAMQAWGGIYLLGVALGDYQMRDAGLWGWNTEARATREYWFDVDAPRPANEGGRKIWPGKGERVGNYKYDEYPYAYNSNITGKGIGWWTWFGGDPLYMHGIQWMPVSPALDYLSWDPDFVAWAYDDMMTGANSSFSHSWFDYTSNTANGEAIEPLAMNDWGNVTLSYLQRANPSLAAQIFDQALEKGLHIASSIGTSHISYYVTHSHLTYGDPDFTVHADIPTAQVWKKDGVYTYIIYNPDDADRKVTFYDQNGSQVKTVTAPARKLAAISADPIPSDIQFSIEGGAIIPPGERAAVHAKVLDQYGAVMTGETVAMNLSNDAPARIAGNALIINEDASIGTKFVLTFSNGELSRQEEITVNERPKGVNAVIVGLPAMCERSNTFSPSLRVTDQYGAETTADEVQWSIVEPDGSSVMTILPISFDHPGAYTVNALDRKLNISTSAEIKVMPSLSVISVGAEVAASSAENVGTMPAGVNDGDESTRWGSSHADNQWIVLDLGEDCFISRVAALWEAAYASRYLIEVAPDGCDTHTISVSYAGQSREVTVPVEDAWTIGADVSNSSSGARVSDVHSSGRYLRLRGVQRATDYGISLYELSVYGLRLSASGDEVIGIDFYLPQVLDRGEAYELSPVGYTASLQPVSPINVEWSADMPAQFSGNTFTPTSYGRYIVKATGAGGVSTDGSVYVNDVEVPASVSFDREQYSVIAGDNLTIGYTVNNQYFAPYSGDISSLTVTVTDENGNPTSDVAFDPLTGIFHSRRPGLYTVTFGLPGSCQVSVKELSDINLALDRPAFTSSDNGGNTGSKAVDGNTDSRWESAWEDNQWLAVELADIYMIDRVRIVWEGAYAKEYSLEVSPDGVDWYQFYYQPVGKGATEEIAFDAVPAKYVRLNCLTRALSAYGFSVKELEVYGSSRLNAADGVAPDIVSFDAATSNGAISATASATNPTGAVLLTLSLIDSSGKLMAQQRAALASGEQWDVDFSPLPTGIYSLTLTAVDAFGNESVRTIENIAVTYSIVGINLALGKYAYASSVENGGLAATNATDGDLATRWGSQFNDDEWIVVDLGTPYLLTDVKIHWNSPAYATHYSILLSATGEEDNFVTTKTVEGFTNTGEPAVSTIETDTPARYVKIIGHKRATGYGTSINEIEVYGRDGDVSSGSILIPSDGSDDSYNDGDERWYNLQGIPVASPSAPGIYIRSSSGRSTKLKKK